MASAVLDCPHCGAQSLGMLLTGMSSPPEHVVSPNGHKPFVTCLGSCPRCWAAFAVELTPASAGTMSLPGLKDVASRMFSSNVATPESMKLRATVLRTPPDATEFPPHLSAPVLKAFKQAEINFRLPDAEEASAMMYRRALELALKETYPSEKGTLLQRIDKLAGKGVLPAAMKDWAHEIRVVGNDGAHELDGVDRADLLAAQGFADSFLRYLISLPKQVELRRSRSDVAAAKEASSEERG